MSETTETVDQPELAERGTLAMNKLAEVEVWRGHVPADRRLQKQLEEHLDRIELIAEVGKEALEAISQLYSYSGYKVATSLATVELLRELANRQHEPSAEEAQAYQQSRQRFLEALSLISELTAGKIIQEVERVPAKNGGGFW
jgi:RNA polymerase-interacting CarD/CdnL/TRCF family regulator